VTVTALPVEDAQRTAVVQPAPARIGARRPSVFGVSVIAVVALVQLAWFVLLAYGLYLAA
jgi:hypothetical protein